MNRLTLTEFPATEKKRNLARPFVVNIPGLQVASAPDVILSNSDLIKGFASFTLTTKAGVITVDGPFVWQVPLYVFPFQAHLEISGVKVPISFRIPFSITMDFVYPQFSQLNDWLKRFSWWPSIFRSLSSPNPARIQAELATKDFNPNSCLVMFPGLFPINQFLHISNAILSPTLVTGDMFLGNCIFSAEYATTTGELVLRIKGKHITQYTMLKLLKDLNVYLGHIPAGIMTGFQDGIISAQQVVLRFNVLSDKCEEKALKWKVAQHTLDFYCGTTIPFDLVLNFSQSEYYLSTVCESNLCMLSYNRITDSFNAKIFSGKLKTFLGMWRLKNNLSKKMNDETMRVSISLSLSKECLEARGNVGHREVEIVVSYASGVGILKFVDPQSTDPPLPLIVLINPKNNLKKLWAIHKFQDVQFKFFA